MEKNMAGYIWKWISSYSHYLDSLRCLLFVKVNVCGYVCHCQWLSQCIMIIYTQAQLFESISGVKNKFRIPSCDLSWITLGFILNCTGCRIKIHEYLRFHIFGAKRFISILPLFLALYQSCIQSSLACQPANSELLYSELCTIDPVSNGYKLFPFLNIKQYQRINTKKAKKKSCFLNEQFLITIILFPGFQTYLNIVHFTNVV